MDTQLAAFAAAGGVARRHYRRHPLVERPRPLNADRAQAVQAEATDSGYKAPRHRSTQRRVRAINAPQAVVLICVPTTCPLALTVGLGGVFSARSCSGGVAP